MIHFYIECFVVDAVRIAVVNGAIVEFEHHGQVAYSVLCCRSSQPARRLQSHRLFPVESNFSAVFVLVEQSLNDEVESAEREL